MRGLLARGRWGAAGLVRPGWGGRWGDAGVEAGVDGDPWRAPEADPHPGALPLRPLSAGEVLVGGAAILRREWRIVYPVAAAAALAGAVLGTPVLLDPLGWLRLAAPSAVLDGAGWPLLAGLAMETAVSSVLVAVVALVAANAALGRPSSPRRVWRRLRRHLLGVAGLGIAVRAVTDATALAGVGVFLSALWGLALPALVTERLSPRAALRRSCRLSLSDWRRVWGLRTAATVGAGLVATGLLLPATFASSQVGGLLLGPAPPGMGVVVSVGRLVLTGLVAPYPAAVQAVLYIDLRMRREGLARRLRTPVSRAARTTRTATATGPVSDPAAAPAGRPAQRRAG
jgi:hypothetical protein